MRGMSGMSGMRLRADVTAGLMALALSGATVAQPKPYVPPPPTKPTGVAPKGDFTKDLPRAGLDADPGQAAGSEGSDEAFRAKAEADAIRKSGAGVRRAGPRLILPVASGRPEVFDSVWPNASGHNESAYEDYRFDGLSPDREFLIVRATYYEGGKVFWISRKTGVRTDMGGEARPSPDGTWVAVANASQAHEFNGLVVWERVGSALVERFRHEPPADRPVFYRFMRWKDNRNIELERTNFGDEITCPGGMDESLAVLSRDGERWALKDVTVPHCRR